jgi:hypothetical protein
VITVVFRSAFIRPHGGLLSNQTAFLESQPIHTIQEVLRRTLSGKHALTLARLAMQLFILLAFPMLFGVTGCLSWRLGHTSETYVDTQTIPRTPWGVHAMLRAGVYIFLGVLIATLTFRADARAERRVALVVGNATYAHAPALRNPRNDASDMAATLRKVGFKVVLGLDLDQTHFADTIQRFARMLDDADVALFYYAGHGLQINGKNYLVSVNARLENEFFVSSETIALDAIVHLMESKVPTDLIFLDACRDNPLEENLRKNLVAMQRGAELGRGLARIEPTGRDTLIAFAAAPGQEAADGKGRHSPFTAALLKYIPRPNLEVSVMLKSVAAEVREETGNSQRPQQLSDMSRTFYFVKRDLKVATVNPHAPRTKGPTPPALPGAAAPSSNNDAMIEVAFWNAAQSAHSCEAIHAYMQRFPKGNFIAIAKLSEQRLCDAGQKRHVTILETAPGTNNPPQAGASAQQVERPPNRLPPPTLQQNPQPAPASDEAPPGRPLGQPQEFADNPPTQPSPSTSANNGGGSAGNSASSAPAAPPSEEKTKVATLEKPAVAPSQPKKEADSDAIKTNIARDLQRELARVGCSVGHIDGKWGRRSRDALRKFDHYVKLDLDPRVPSRGALEAVRKHHGPVCPKALERARREPSERTREKPRAARERASAAPKNDWRAISPLCQSPYPMPGRVCCTYDPPYGTPRIICP